MTAKEKPAADHKKVMSFLAAVRGSFLDAAIVFTMGGCYGLYQILKEVWPESTAFMTKDEEHVVTRIGGRFYEIRGEYTNLQGKTPELTELNEQQHEYWETVACSQRVEYIIKKYNK